jgi:hypothetical protein
MTWPIGFSSLIGCSFLILEEAVNPESAKDSARYPRMIEPVVFCINLIPSSEPDKYPTHIAYFGSALRPRNNPSNQFP